jgi:alkylation response protein AidB-like acyl-CoA dehydrogenase
MAITLCPGTDWLCSETVENEGSRKQDLAELLARFTMDHVPRGDARGALEPWAGAAYMRTLLHLDDRFEVAAARWAADRSCALHGHSDSTVLLRVLGGSLVEERYLPVADGRYRYECAVLRAGDESYLPPGSFHRIWCIDEASTVHAFSPPPVDATSSVPAELGPVLAEAKSRMSRANGSQGNRLNDSRETIFRSMPLASVGTCSAKRSIVESMREHGDSWAAREQEQTRGGQTRVAAATLAELRASGILAAPVPVYLGGWGSSLHQCAQAVRLLAQKAPATALAVAMPLGNAATARIPDSAVASPLRQELDAGRQWIACQAIAGRILAVANSEPGGGGDLARTRTVAARGDDGVFRLTGKKSFATIGPDADYFLCAARRQDTDVIDGFFVARDAPGVILDQQWDPLGMRATASVGLTLENAPSSALLGFPGCLQGVNARHWSTVLFAAVFVGLGEGALAAAVDAVGSSAASCYVRASLAESALNLEAAAGLLEAVCSDERWPLPAPARERTQRAKTFAARTAVETATRAAMLGGGRAYRADHPVSRFLHDALAGPLLRPTIANAMDGIASQLFPAAR